jgi:hypothetical protein
MLTRSTVAPLTWLAWLALAVPQRAGQETQPSSSLLAVLPGDAVFVLAVEDFESLWKRAPLTAWGQLAAEPLLAPLWSRLDTYVHGELSEELSAKTTLDGLQGGAFFIGPEAEEHVRSMGFVLRMRPGFPALARALRENAERGGTHEAVELDGHSMLVGRGGHSRSWEVYFEWSQGIGAVETGGRESALDLARTLVRRLESGTSDDALSARLADRRPAERATLEAYLNVGALIESTLEPQGEQDKEVYEALQLADFGWNTYHLSLGEGSAFELDATLELPRTGLFPLLATHARPAPTKIARLAPADAIEVATLGYDVQGAWRSVAAWLVRELPDFSEEMARSFGRTALDVDLEQDLFAQLSGEFGRLLLPLPPGQRPAFGGVAVSLWLGLLGTPGAASTNVYLVALEDERVVEALLEKLLKRTDATGQISEEEVAGELLHFIEIPELQLQPSWAFVDGALVLGLHRSALRSVLEQATHEPPHAWLDAERAAALRDDGTACGSSLADLQALARIGLASPLALMLGMAAQMPDRSDELDAASLQAIAAALPGLVEKHVRGTARTTLSLEGRVLRYRFWTR